MLLRATSDVALERARRVLTSLEHLTRLFASLEHEVAPEVTLSTNYTQRWVTG